jgi:hypothetical protein
MIIWWLLILLFQTSCLLFREDREAAIEIVSQKPVFPKLENLRSYEVSLIKQGYESFSVRISFQENILRIVLNIPLI